MDSVYLYTYFITVRLTNGEVFTSIQSGLSSSFVLSEVSKAFNSSDVADISIDVLDVVLLKEVSL